jgi:hypothetical protein
MSTRSQQFRVAVTISFTACFFRHVGCKRHGAAVRPNLMRTMGSRCAIDVDDRNLGACAGKSLRNRSADPTAAAGHDRNFIVECSHLALLVCQIFE